MFKNIEKTLCALAKLTFYLSLVAIIAGVITYIAGVYEAPSIAMVGLGIVAGGVAAAIGSFPMYGFGIIIGEVKKIRATVCKPRIDSSDMPEL